MAKLTNVSQSPVRVFDEGRTVDIAPGGTEKVRASSAWADNVFVKAGWLKYDAGQSGDDGAPSGAPKGEYLKIPQIKEALAAKGIEIPEGVTKRDDLLALLEAASE